MKCLNLGEEKCQAEDLLNEQAGKWLAQLDARIKLAKELLEQMQRERILFLTGKRL